MLAAPDRIEEESSHARGSVEIDARRPRLGRPAHGNGLLWLEFEVGVIDHTSPCSPR
jgi:hypothetical protein